MILRYIKKTLETQLSGDQYRELVEAIRGINCVRMAPFDEASARAFGRRLPSGWKLQ
jgi:hypothetical protein